MKGTYHSNCWQHKSPEAIHQQKVNHRQSRVNPTTDSQKTRWRHWKPTWDQVMEAVCWGEKTGKLTHWIELARDEACWEWLIESQLRKPHLDIPEPRTHTQQNNGHQHPGMTKTIARLPTPPWRNNSPHLLQPQLQTEWSQKNNQRLPSLPGTRTKCHGERDLSEI